MNPALATALAALVNLIAPQLPEAIAKALREGLRVSVTVEIGPAGPGVYVEPRPVIPPSTDDPGMFTSPPWNAPIVTYYGVQTYGAGDEAVKWKITTAGDGAFYGPVNTDGKVGK